MVKNAHAKAGDARDAYSTSGWGRSPGGGIPTPVLLPGKSHGQRSLVGYSPWGGSQRFGQLVKEKEIKREVISGGEKEKKVRKSKGEEQRKEKIKNIYIIIIF